jgi:uncharacterized cupredoxin-like copper-binding protein
MKTKSGRSLAAAFAVLVPALGGGFSADVYAHEGAFSAGKPGNPKRPYKTVTVSMHEGDGKMYYAPERLEVKRGEQVKFVIKNEGLLAHEFILADTAANLKHAELMQKYPDMEHDDPNGKTLQPKARTEMLWRFSKRGEFEFACLIPGHREAGMTGKVIVK